MTDTAAILKFTTYADREWPEVERAMRWAFSEVGFPEVGQAAILERLKPFHALLHMHLKIDGKIEAHAATPTDAAKIREQIAEVLRPEMNRFRSILLLERMEREVQAIHSAGHISDAMLEALMESAS